MGVEEVAAGAQWLDENFPGWEREIDLGTLNLNSCQNCVCGQALHKLVTECLQTGFDVALKVATGSTFFYGKPKEWAVAHGFYVKFGEWEQLESLWLDLIKERFSNGNLSDNG